MPVAGAGARDSRHPAAGGACAGAAGLARAPWCMCYASNAQVGLAWPGLHSACVMLVMCRWGRPASGSMVRVLRSSSPWPHGRVASPACERL